MQTSNANKHGMSNDPVWQFIAEYPLSEFLSDHDKGGELTAGLLFQTMRELGIPPEYLENIEMTLTGFAKQALVHFKQGSLESPGRIRVFCQKKEIADVNSPKISRSAHPEQTIEPTQIVGCADSKVNEGWGFFLVKRDECSLNNSYAGLNIFVDLYLYKEGE